MMCTTTYKTLCRSIGAAMAVILALGLLTPVVQAQGRADTVRTVWKYQTPSLDPNGTGLVRSTWGLSFHIYDRLTTFGTVPLDEFTSQFDYDKIRGELAESWKISPDRKSITLRLREDARFHDGRPVTAEDVRWSLERAMTLQTSTNIMKIGSLRDPDQIEVVDEHTVRITVPEPNRYTLLVLATPMAPIMNAELAQEHATDKDPWATEWLKNNTAGSGAYKVESFRSDQVILTRFDDWASGPQPHFTSAIFQTVPDPTTRAALVERGSADVAFDLTPEALETVRRRDDARVLAIPMRNQFEFLALNTQMEPFDDVRVRQAVAYAIPYQEVFDHVFRGRGIPLFDDTDGVDATFPQPHGYRFDPEEARSLLAQAGYSEGLETTLSLCTCEPHHEPVAVALKDRFAEAGIEVQIQKLSSAQFDEYRVANSLPMFLDNMIAWLALPDYWISIAYSGDWRSNAGNFENARIEELLTRVRGDVDNTTYEQTVREMVEIVFRELPLVPLRQAAFEAVVSKDLTNYIYWFHTLPDARFLKRQ